MLCPRADKLGVLEMGWIIPDVRGDSESPAEINSSPFLRRLNEDTVIILIRWGLPNHRAERKTRARKTIPSDIRAAAAAEI